MSTLYLMVGIQASGKSTYANKLLNKLSNTVVVSRDEIRFSLLKEGEDYFAHEKEVFNTFIDDIKTSLKLYDNVIADATHLTKKSRMKTINALNLEEDVEVVPIVLCVYVPECIRRNNSREGLAKVPDEVIQNAYDIFEFPDVKEYNYARIIKVL